ncbi:uncharacterized protein PgNI_06816 [Pyricularia grisea]|uniref:Uncharacterized protein n=1 Tax=Pyricularia grisea TaxID=148305 RepID=A0A6P8B2I0_PYRGI|nr:uncharacterized protein PgNI_06816 [Pyricularia grisea]TLD09004.1 hypothetical protein PgNI_06816 [Pyricularia grisea]
MDCVGGVTHYGWGKFEREAKHRREQSIPDDKGRLTFTRPYCIEIVPEDESYPSYVNMKEITYRVKKSTYKQDTQCPLDYP